MVAGSAFADFVAMGRRGLVVGKVSIHLIAGRRNL